MSLLDTGSSDPSIKPRELDQLDPNGILPEHAEIDYELADSTSQRMKTYKLDIMMSNAQGNIVNNWHRDIVAVEANNSAECLSGIGLFRRGYTATNPQGGPAARNFDMHFAVLKTDIVRAVPSGRAR